MKKLLLIGVLAVLAIGFVGCNDDETIVSPVPAAPQGVYSITGDHAVYLYWNGIYDRNVRQYIVYRSLDAQTGYVEIGNVPAESNPNQDLLIYEYIDSDVTNGITYYYAVSAVNSDGRESELSAEEVFDTPRPDGVITLFPNNVAPELAGFNFEAGSAVADTSPIADIYIDMTGDIYYINVADSVTDIMDMGYTSSFDDISFSPSTSVNTGWAALPWVELVVGHTYIVWTRDNHFAKIRPELVNPSGSVRCQWAWQIDPGNPQLVPALNLTRPVHNTDYAAKLRDGRAQE